MWLDKKKMFPPWLICLNHKLGCKELLSLGIDAAKSIHFLVNGSQNYHQYHSQKVNLMFQNFLIGFIIVFMLLALDFHKHLFKIATKFNLKS